MGKLQDLATVKTAKRRSFVYTPPDAAFGAGRILLKVDTSAVSRDVVAAALRGLRRVNPLARIVIIDRVPTLEAFVTAGISDLLDDEMREARVDDLLMKNYRNHAPTPLRYVTMTAPVYIDEYDCVIGISALQVSGASLANWAGVFTEARALQDEGTQRIAFQGLQEDNILQDVFFTIGQFIHGAIVEVGQIDRILWGDNLLAVDEAAYRAAAMPVPAYIDVIRRQQE